MAVAQARYQKWKCYSVREKSVWSRYKEGSKTLPALVLFTGLGTSGTRLNPMIDELSFRYKGRIVGIELPGQGRSERFGWRRNAIDYATEAEEILATVIPDFDPRNTVFIGHCNSPFFINAYAQKQEVAGTVLLNPFPLDSYLMMLRSCINLGIESVGPTWRKLVRFGKSTGNTTKAMDAALSRMRKLTNFLDAAVTWRTSAFSTQLNESPVLIAIGENDAVVLPGFIHRLSLTISNSQTRIIPGCTHFSTYKQPHETAKLILEFVSRISGQPASP